MQDFTVTTLCRWSQPGTLKDSEIATALRLLDSQVCNFVYMSWRRSRLHWHSGCQ